MGALCSKLLQAAADPGLHEPLVPVRRLGRGRSGLVWLASDTASGQQVAVKLVKRGFDAATAAHLGYEIRLQAALSSPYVVPLHQVLLTRQHLGLVMAFVPGGTLQQHIQAHPVADEQAACFLFRQIAAAVAWLHSHQVGGVAACAARKSSPAQPSLPACWQQQHVRQAGQPISQPGRPACNGADSTPDPTRPICTAPHRTAPTPSHPILCCPHTVYRWCTVT